MPKYRYIGKLVDGQNVEGMLKADSPEDLQNILLKIGVFLTSYTISKSVINQYITRSLRSNDITRMTRQLAALSESGITFKDSLESVKEQITDKTLNEMLNDIAASVDSGRSIADSFRQFPVFFDTLFTSMIEAGEISGTLDVSLDRIATYRERSDDTNKKIRSALSYPLLVLMVTLLVVFVLVIYIIPIFASMYENFGTELPKLTQYVVAISEWAQDNIYVFLIALIIGAVGIILSILNSRVRYFISAIQLRIPFVGRILKKIINARFARTLGTLLQSGVPTLFSVEIAIKTTGNAYIQQKISDLTMLLSQGKSFTDTIGNYPVFSKTVIRMAAAGEKTGQLGKMLSKAADFYESEIDHEIGTLTTLFEPMIIIFLGVFIAFILVAMYLPLFDLMSTM
ncbi:MAG: type II secretion system F family protein [candidate division Zixibacteria bacterium]|nr:type II secretion system F family protein [candidate division Zixibacteria bacterium]